MHLFWAMALKDLFFFSSLFSTHLPRKKKKIYLMAQKRGQEEEGGSGVVVKVVFKGFFWWLPRREGRKKSTISQISVLEGKKVEIFFRSGGKYGGERSINYQIISASVFPSFLANKKKFISMDTNVSGCTFHRGWMVQPLNIRITFERRTEREKERERERNIAGSPTHPGEINLRSSGGKDRFSLFSKGE